MKRSLAWVLYMEGYGYDYEYLWMGGGGVLSVCGRGGMFVDGRLSEREGEIGR